MIKKIFFLMAIFILSCSVTFAAAKPNENNENSAQVEQKNSEQQNLNSSVVDTAEVFSSYQKKALTEKIQQLEQKYKIRIGINFFKDIDDEDIDTVANERLRKYYGDGQNGGIVLTVDMVYRKWNIALDAKLNQRILSYSDVAYLHDEFYDKLHNDDYYGAANAYLASVDELLNYYEQNGTPYDRSQEFDPISLAVAVGIAIVLGVVIREWLIGSMSNVKFASEARDYLKRETVRLTEQRDTYLYTNITRRTKSKSSSGGGGRSGGGSSGGGSF